MTLTNTSTEYEIDTDELFATIDRQFPQLGWAEDVLHVDPLERYEKSASARAIYDVANLHGMGLIDDAVATRAMRMVLNVFTRISIFASVAPDQDRGVVFFWAADQATIEIDLLAPAGYFWSVTGVDGKPTVHGQGPELPIVELKHELRMFSKLVDSLNPDWRSTFAEMRECGS